MMRRRNAISPTSLEACQLQVFAAQYNATVEQPREDSSKDDSNRKVHVSRRNALSSTSLEACQLQIFAAHYNDSEESSRQDSSIDNDDRIIQAS
jgi:hypothetical protein